MELLRWALHLMASTGLGWVPVRRNGLGALGRTAGHMLVQCICPPGHPAPLQSRSAAGAQHSLGRLASLPLLLDGTRSRPAHVWPS